MCISDSYDFEYAVKSEGTKLALQVILFTFSSFLWFLLFWLEVNMNSIQYGAGIWSLQDYEVFL